MQYVAPTSIDETLQALAMSGESAKIIAGGTDLIVQMRAGLLRPTLIVDLKQLALVGIREEASTVTIGARTTHTELAASIVINRHFPALAAACRLVGGPSTRNRGTLGGNIMNASPAADALPPLAIYDAPRWWSPGQLAGARYYPFKTFFSGTARQRSPRTSSCRRSC